MTIVRSGSATDTGLVRSVNQDLALEGTNLFAVADGMGGHAGGEVASRMAIETLSSAFSRKPTAEGLAAAVREANEAVWIHSQNNPDLRGMGTTMTAMALVQNDEADVLYLVNVGDSRAYQLHDGVLVQVTQDHSLAEEMVRNGEMTASEAAVHPHRHILTRALGVAPEVELDVWALNPSRGDRYLLCSDGLTNELEGRQIRQVLSSVLHPQEAANILVQAARTHGGSDNITVVVVDVVMGEKSESTEGPSASKLVVGAAEGSSKKKSAPASPGVSSSEPSRRQKRKIKRRERRLARGRRLITVRTFIFIVCLVAVVAGVYGALRWYDTNSYFVQVDQNELVIYQGRIGGFLWFHPEVVQRTGVTVGDIPSTYVPAVTAGVEETSVADAQGYVNNLKSQQQAQAQAAQPNPVASTTTTPVKAG